MVFHSVLFETPEDRATEATREAPAFFGDLNLDQIIDAITLGKQEYHLKAFFYTPLNTSSAIEYRHDVMRDLEKKTLFEQIQSFARNMRAMRQHVEQAEKLYYKYQKERWFLDAVDMYCKAVDRLAHDLSLADLTSRGLLGFRDYLMNYATSERFRSELFYDVAN
jgi:DNA mismatch repair protein MutS